MSGDAFTIFEEFLDLLRPHEGTLGFLLLLPCLWAEEPPSPPPLALSLGVPVLCPVNMRRIKVFGLASGMCLRERKGNLYFSMMLSEASHCTKKRCLHSG